jgi:hypothetical protein
MKRPNRRDVIVPIERPPERKERALSAKAVLAAGAAVGDSVGAATLLQTSPAEISTVLKPVTEISGDAT